MHTLHRLVFAREQFYDEVLALELRYIEHQTTVVVHVAHLEALLQLLRREAVDVGEGERVDFEAVFYAPDATRRAVSTGASTLRWLCCRPTSSASLARNAAALRTRACRAWRRGES